VDLDIAALRPPKLLESPVERRDPGLSFRVVLGIRHQHADAPHPVGLLRARGQWPSGRGTAENDEELASPHLPPIDVERHHYSVDGGIARLYALDRGLK